MTREVAVAGALLLLAACSGPTGRVVETAETRAPRGVHVAAGPAAGAEGISGFAQVDAFFDYALVSARASGNTTGGEVAALAGVGLVGMAGIKTVTDAPPPMTATCTRYRDTTLDERIAISNANANSNGRFDYDEGRVCADVKYHADTTPETPFAETESMGLVLLGGARSRGASWEEGRSLAGNLALRLYYGADFGHVTVPVSNVEVGMLWPFGDPPADRVYDGQRSHTPGWYFGTQRRLASILAFGAELGTTGYAERATDGKLEREWFVRLCLGASFDL